MGVVPLSFPSQFLLQGLNWWHATCYLMQPVLHILLLVQYKNLSFREGYKISAKLVNYAEKKNKQLNELNLDEIRQVKKDLDKDVMKVFDVTNSVNLKSSYGGTSTTNIKKVISKLKKEFKWFEHY